MKSSQSVVDGLRIGEREKECIMAKEGGGEKGWDKAGLIH